MAAFYTPGQLARRAEFYHELAGLISAGIGLPQALQNIRSMRHARPYRTNIDIILKELNQGATFAEAIGKTTQFFPVFDEALLHAGEKSGRLDACFRSLGQYYEERAKLWKSVISDMAYPVFMLHFMFFLAPIPTLFIGQTSVFKFLAAVFTPLLPFYIGAAVLIYFMQGTRSSSVRSIVEQFTRLVPVLGKARFELAMARLAGSLEALISAGVLIIDAWDLSADACGSIRLKKLVASWKPHLQGGATPSELIRSSGVFPDVFTSLYATGEMAGKLDEHLRRVQAYFQDRASRKLHELAVWTPRLVYIGLCLYLGYMVVTFWVGYYDGIMKSF